MSRTNTWNPCLFVFIIMLAALPAVAQDTATEEETEQVDVIALMNDGLGQMQMGDMEEAAKSFEKVIEAEPKNFQAMVMAAQAYMGWGVEMAQDDRKAANKPLRRSAELMRMVKKQKPQLNQQEKQVLAIAIYNEACCAAVDGDTDNAIKFLKEAIETGFNDLTTLEDDADFKSIKNDERFKAIVEELSEEEDDDDYGDMEDADV